MPSSRLIARAVASASSSVAPRHVTCPILRPRRGSRLPYRCSLAAGARARASSRARAASRRRRRTRCRPAGSPSPRACAARVAQRQAGEHARLLLELRRHAGVDRVVAAVVRARRDLVDEQLAVRARRTARRTARRDSRAPPRPRSRRRARLRRECRRRRAPARSTRRGCRRDGDSRRPATSTTSPSSSRATITDTSHASAMQLLEHARGLAASRRTRRTTSSRVRTRDLALAVVAEARALDDARAAAPSSTGAASARLRSTANGATAKPLPARNVFSLMRSCAMATLAAAGRHAQRRGRGIRARRPERSRTRSSRRRTSARAPRAPADRDSRPRDAGRRRCRPGCRSPGSSTATR